MQPPAQISCFAEDYVEVEAPRAPSEAEETKDKKRDPYENATIIG